MRKFVFSDRNEAGRALAEKLSRHASRPDVVVLALPRGGVPLGFEIARTLHTPLDVFLVRKLGVPGHEELAIGAIATGGLRVFNESVIEKLRITTDQLEEVCRREQIELERREQAFRHGRALVPVFDCVCILVDDGLATGSTMRAAVLALRKLNPRSIVMAVPVAAADTFEEVGALVDEAVCLRTPEPFVSVGQWYEDFAQLTDEEVRQYLDRAAAEMAH